MLISFSITENDFSFNFVHQGYFNKGGSLHKGTDGNSFYKGGHSGGKKGSKGHHIGSKAHLNKGHNDKV